MSPSILIPLLVIVFVLGAVGYSYHEGKAKGEQICEAEKLAAQLKQTQQELKVSQQLTEFQQEQVGEAQAQFEQEKLKNDTLQQEIDKLNLSTSSECVPDSVLQQLREFRQLRKPR